MTYSLGFRTPSQQELAADWFQHLVSLCDQQRLRDPDDLQNANLAELTAGIHQEAAQLFMQLPTANSPDFRRWLGCYLTDPKPQFHIEPAEHAWSTADLADWLATPGRALGRHPFARLAWARLSEDEVVMYYQGESLTQPQHLLEAIRLIAEHRRIDNSTIAELLSSTPAAGALLLRLINEGVLEPVENVSCT